LSLIVCHFAISTRDLILRVHTAPPCQLHFHIKIATLESYSTLQTNSTNSY